MRGSGSVDRFRFDFGCGPRLRLFERRLILGFALWRGLLGVRCCWRLLLRGCSLRFVRSLLVDLTRELPEFVVKLLYDARLRVRQIFGARPRAGCGGMEVFGKLEPGLCQTSESVDGDRRV